jgi:virulence factor Mce-like protein
MRRRRAATSIASNPVLIGAATTLVIIVAVFLAYNANSGLPFVPTYQLKAAVPNAANLVAGNDVRVGGTRVGTVSDIVPVRHRDGSVTALLTLKLQTDQKPLPRDSTVLIRSRSALGLKYVSITRGSAGRGFPDGGTIPLANATPRPVEFDEVLSTFDDRTRLASQGNLREFGNGLAGRGAGLNEAIAAFNPLLRSLVPVMRNLSDPRTNLRGFFPSLARVARIVAPAAEQQAALFRNLDTTFSALADVARPYIQRSIEGGPPALDEAIRDLPAQRPFLANSAGLFAELRPGVRSLRPAARDLADAFTIGTPTLRRTVALNQRLEPLLRALQRFSEDPLVPIGIADLLRTVTLLNPTLAFAAPAQTKCNYATLFLRNTANLLSDGDSNGTYQRFIIIATPQGPNNEGGPSSGPATGPTPANHLHANPYPNAASPGTKGECEAGNERYAVGKTVIGHTPGVDATSTEVTRPSGSGQ